ncbi:MAG TPA: family 16 glycoside hydrolase [Verrucomicrobiae bacterium]|nr:family 16 glycoside hydrolase [Verrucomicrobiae bacterium]
MKLFLVLAFALFAGSAFAAERTFPLDDYPVDQPPPGFKNILIGSGKPAIWKTVLDDVPVESNSTNANPAFAKRAVVAQTSHEPFGNRFSILLFDDETFGDFKLTARVKITGGILEQMAGIVFRFRNESNYYVVTANAQRSAFQCFKVENGVVRPPFSAPMDIAENAWHTLKIESEGTRILCGLDGNDAIKLIDNSGKTSGKIGFWTKSDSTACFTDVRMTYKPHEMLAHALVRSALEDYPRVLGLQIFAARNPGETATVIASKDPKELGQTAAKAEQDVIANGHTYFSKGKDTVTVTLPLRDRNGDPIAAVRVIMESFLGQTEDNAIVRAKPIVKDMQARVLSLDRLFE